MQLIDEGGKLFGVVNAVDALTVGVLLAVLVAVVAVVGLLGNGGEPETRYATIELESQPSYVVDRMDEGDGMRVEGHDHNLTITDVYVTPTDDGQASITVRAQVDGELAVDDVRDDRVFEFAGERLRPGQTVDVDTLEYTVTGTVTALDHEKDSLPTRELPVVLEATTSTTTADEIAVGDAVRVGPHTVATITDVSTYPVGADERRVVAGVELSTLERGTTATFAGESVTTDASLTLALDSYDLEGEIVRYGTADSVGEPTTTDAEVNLENVDPAVNESLEVGATHTERGDALATIRAVETEPADVVLESKDGELHHHDHPTNEDVTLAVELRTRETPTGLRFHGESLREGDTVFLVFGDRTVQGEVTRLG